MATITQKAQHVQALRCHALWGMACQTLNTLTISAGHLRNAGRCTLASDRQDIKHVVVFVFSFVLRKITRAVMSTHRSNYRSE